MNNLAVKYRPASLSQVRGHSNTISLLQSFVRQPTSKAFLFSGPPGCGKTSSAYALAADLGVDVSKKEWGGLHEIASGEMTAETVRELFKTTMHYSTWHGSGWKVVIANEADNMSEKAAFIWLDVLEHLPEKCVVIFTTNEPEKLPRRFRERCEQYFFKTPVRQFGQDASPAEKAAQILIDDVWMSELGHNHSPRLSDLDGWSENGHLSFRAVLQSLDPLIRAQRQEDEAQKARGEIQPKVTSGETPRGEVNAGNAGDAFAKWRAKMGFEPATA